MSGKYTNLPAAKLRAIGKVGIFGERVVLPAAGIVDHGAPPDSRSSVEIEKVAAPRPRAMFDHEMAVEQDALDFSEQRIIRVQIRPARLAPSRFCDS